MVVTQLKNFMSHNNFRTTITPFFIILGILIILLLIFSVYYLFIDNNGGNALGGTIAAFGFIIFLFILGFEQFILMSIRVNKNVIWVVESLILIIAVIYICLNGISIG